MNDVAHDIQRLLVRYQRHLLLRVVVLGLLSAACLTALLWRTQQRLSLSVALGIGAVGVAAFVLWQWRVLRQVRRMREQATLALDNTLGLQGRLVTAAEFAQATETPLLYPLLMQDPVLSAAAISRRIPRLVDRRAVALGMVLLLLLLWPQASHLMQLAMRPPTASPPSEPPPQPLQSQPPQPQPQSSQSQQRSSQQSQQQQQSGGGGGNSSQQQSGAGQSNANSSNSNQPSQNRSERPGGAQGSSQQPQQSPSGAGQSQQSQSKQTTQGGSTQQSSQSQQANSQQGQGSKQNAPQSAQAMNQNQIKQNQTNQSQANQPQQQAKASQDRSMPAAGGPSKPAERANETHQSKSSTGQAQAPAGGEQGAEQKTQLAKESGAGQKLSPQQEALKADIQELLKDLSAELKGLQADLDTKQQTKSDKPNPLPGTGTDTQLYGNAQQPERPSGARLPVQLEVDTQPTATPRRGGGVGTPSGQVVDATPQQQPEDATLAEQAPDEQAGNRQAIPPEYRPVFERLSHSPESSSSQH